jgi:uncharacterized protein YgiM (DUF1202 family)
MALARNLNKRNRYRKPNKKKLFGNKKQYIIYGAVIFAVLLGAYGIVNLVNYVPTGEKQEIVYETGDRPLPQTIKIWVVADGGLNLREKADPKSSILILVPDGTELEALETKDDWYRVVYMNKEGWIHKDYTTIQAPAESPTKGWKTYKNDAYKYTLQHPSDWVAVDYGKNEASGSLSYVGLGLQLPEKLDPTKLPPIIVRVTPQSKEEVSAVYSKKSNVESKKATISGVEGTKYTYMTSSGTQVTSYVVTKGSNTFILEESGGYEQELALVVGSLNLP